MEFNESPINPEVQHLGKKTYQYKEKEDAEIHPHEAGFGNACDFPIKLESALKFHSALQSNNEEVNGNTDNNVTDNACLLYTSPSPRDRQKSRMPSSACKKKKKKKKKKKQKKK
eukprot:TRINITY_DN11536_c0_g2_i1.p1 TRINITY_DN11536_c0_g2~~TRINITY_DN11536_c0_g2_i1.p1  ORF type:complete len:114 (-),score=33.40 TRINITY_DN11536_c0_g2_i1:14-355(-)